MCDYELIRNEIIKSMKKVDRQYYMTFAAGINEERNTIKRERNFCYELYHQMRSNNELMNLIDDYVFSCELDKRGHKLIKDSIIPDFILHRPGKMSERSDDNYIVIEVKATLDIDGIAKDFNTLSLMIHKYYYQYGIFLLINHSLEELRMNIDNICRRTERSEITNEQKNKFSKIDVICMKSQNSEADIINLDKLIKGGKHESY